MSDSEESYGWVPVDGNIQDEDIETTDSDEMIISTDIVKKEKIDLTYNDDGENNQSVTRSDDERNNRNSPDFFLNSSNGLKLNSLDREVLNNFIKEKNKFNSLGPSGRDWFTEDDDLWMIQCPSGFDVASLCNLPILDSDKTKIKVPNSKFECVATEKDIDQNITVILPSTSNNPCAIQKHKLKGKFVIREKLKHRFEAIAEEENHSKIPFPSDLKLRHPIFGGNFKKYIKLPNCIKEKLTSPPKCPAKKIKEEIIDNTQPEETSTSKSSLKKKRKSSPTLYEPPIKKEKKTWDSEVSIEENLFSSLVKKSKKT